MSPTRKDWLALFAGGMLFSTAIASAAEKQLAQGAEVKAESTSAESPTDRFPRPIPMGVSISNINSAPFIYAGTAGLKVQSTTNPNAKFILSNNHVLGTVGPKLCPGSAPVGTPTIQPGSIDIGKDPGPKPFYEIGKFADRVDLKTGLTAKNFVDAAISATTDALASSTILNIGEPNPMMEAPSMGLLVTKSGRTTGTTTAKISAVNVTINVSYGSGCPVYHFVRQVEIDSPKFSGAGDSGSAILDADTKAPVALLYAGGSSSTFGNDIRYVYYLLRVLPVGGSSAAESISSSLAEKDSQMAFLEGVQERNEDDLFRTPGVVGVGLSRDNTGWFIKVFARELTPELVAAIPPGIEGVRVRIFGSGEIRAY